MMYRTVLENIPGDEDAGIGRVEMWRVRFGKVQLMCPKCYSWFRLPKDIEIDAQGNVADTIYHVCDNADPDKDDDDGWVVLPQLKGWKGRGII